jgi:hypothetical protein
MAKQGVTQPGRQSDGETASLRQNKEGHTQPGKQSDGDTDSQRQSKTVSEGALSGG